MAFRTLIIFLSGTVMFCFFNSCIFRRYNFFFAICKLWFFNNLFFFAGCGYMLCLFLMNIPGMFFNILIIPHCKLFMWRFDRRFIFKFRYFFWNENGSFCFSRNAV